MLRGNLGEAKSLVDSLQKDKNGLLLEKKNKWHHVLMLKSLSF
jgi:hypothetical protein